MILMPVSIMFLLLCNEKFANNNHFSQDEVSIYTVLSSDCACRVNIVLRTCVYIIVDHISYPTE